MFVRLDHVGLVAYSIEEARAILGDALGLRLDEARSKWPEGSYFAPEQTYNYFFDVGEGETQVEVLIPAPGATSGTARYLAKRGPGLHHLCYACLDVEAEAARLRANGLEEIPLNRTGDGRATAAFFRPGSAGGVLTELVPVRPRPAS
jgi:methylmalonyl-CoA/ethylmalonyl-CoA epimerase